MRTTLLLAALLLSSCRTDGAALSAVPPAFFYPTLPRPQYVAPAPTSRTCYRTWNGGSQCYFY